MHFRGTVARVVFYFLSCILSAPAAYSASRLLFEIRIVTPAGKISERVHDLLERQLAAKITIWPQRGHYQRFPELPVPVCENDEYYLFGPGNELLNIGCLMREQETAAILRVREAMRRYETEVRNGGNPTVLMRVPKSRL